MKNPLALRPRERRLTLITAVVIGSWMVVSKLVQPLWDRTRELQLYVEAQTEKLDAIRHLLEQAPSIEREYQQLSAYLEAEGEEQAQGSFLNELEALSRTSNLQLNLKPRPVKQEERLSRFEVELDVEGVQDNLLAFLDALLNMPRLISVERLRISSVPMKDRVLRANLVVQKLTFH